MLLPGRPCPAAPAFSWIHGIDVGPARQSVVDAIRIYFPVAPAAARTDNKDYVTEKQRFMDCREPVVADIPAAIKKTDMFELLLAFNSHMG
jgi:hypothetical protein